MTLSLPRFDEFPDLDLVPVPTPGQDLSCYHRRPASTQLPRKCTVREQIEYSRLCNG